MGDDDYDAGRDSPAMPSSQRIYDTDPEDLIVCSTASLCSAGNLFRLFRTSSTRDSVCMRDGDVETVSCISIPLHR